MRILKDNLKSSRVFCKSCFSEILFTTKHFRRGVTAGRPKFKNCAASQPSCFCAEKLLWTAQVFFFVHLGFIFLSLHTDKKIRLKKRLYIAFGQVQVLNFTFLGSPFSKKHKKKCVWSFIVYEFWPHMVYFMFIGRQWTEKKRLN